MRLPQILPVSGINFTPQAFDPATCAYEFYLVHGVYEWEVRTFGIPKGHSGVLNYRTEVRFGDSVSHAQEYITHEEALLGNTHFILICTLAESPDELQNIFRMVEAHVPGSKATS